MGIDTQDIPEKEVKMFNSEQPKYPAYDPSAKSEAPIFSAEERQTNAEAVEDAMNAVDAVPDVTPPKAPRVETIASGYHMNELLKERRAGNPKDDPALKIKSSLNPKFGFGSKIRGLFGRNQNKR